MKSLKTFILYTSSVVLGSAVAISASSLFLSKVRAQTGATAPSAGAPSKGDLPPEFATEAAPAAPQPSMPTVPQEVQAPVPPTGSAALPPDMGPSGSANFGVWTYVPTNKRDPFRPYKTFRAEVKKDKGKEEKIDPLQKLDLSKINLIGIMWDINKPKALIKDQDGNLYEVKRYAQIGRRNGVVKIIREGQMVVVESSEEDGKIVHETHVFELAKEAKPAVGGVK